MEHVLAALVLTAPIGLVALAFRSRRSSDEPIDTLFGIAERITLLNLVIAIAAAALIAVHGPVSSIVLGLFGVGLQVRLDAVSGVLFLLVAFVGLIVVRYSRAYLAGDPGQARFLGGLALTLAAVTALVLSGNLLQLVGAWIATSLALHRLLLFYPERRAARSAARKKFVTARIGDVCLIVAAMIVANRFGTGDLAVILDSARSLPADTAIGGLGVATLLIAIAALLKSAQFPTHGWLVEVMETPTPVSALLHAGIINAGGFLVIRFADVMLLSPGTLHLLALVGGFTALFGATVMLTQTSVKVSLAWSTVAQMGFMLLQCGLGVFALALLHIVAHSLYKAHAFLSSGSVIELRKASWSPDTHAPVAPGRLLTSLALSLLLYALVGAILGLFVSTSAAIFALGSILIMGLTILLSESMQGRRNLFVIGRGVLAATAATIVYFVLQALALEITAGTLPSIPEPTTIGWAILLLAVVSFGTVTVLQILAPARQVSPTWRRARVHLANGLYANAVFDRLVDTFAGVPRRIR